MTFLAGALFGASIALVLVMILRRPPGITKHARKEPIRRKWRDLPVQAKWEWDEEIGGIRYEHLGMTGEEV